MYVDIVKKIRWYYKYIKLSSYFTKCFETFSDDANEYIDSLTLSSKHSGMGFVTSKFRTIYS